MSRRPTLVLAALMALLAAPAKVGVRKLVRRADAIEEPGFFQISN